MTYILLFHFLSFRFVSFFSFIALFFSYGMKTCFWTLLDSTDRLLEEQELTRKKEEFIAQLKSKFRLVFEILKKDLSCR